MPMHLIPNRGAAPLALLIASLCATAAHGQAAPAGGSVTVGGVADVAARVVSNEGVGNLKSVVSGSNSTSRLIVRGSEDLGGGLSAGFHLEHGIRLDTGEAVQPTQFWDRRSTVSLVSRSLGELRLGRDFVPSYVVWTRHDPFSYVGVGGSTNLISASAAGPMRGSFAGSNTLVRASNAVQWLAPAPAGGAKAGGFDGGVLLAPGEGSDAAAGQHKVVGLRAGWSGGAWAVAAAHTRTTNGLTDAAGGAFRDSTVGGSWDAGPVRLSLAWRRFEQGDAQQTNWLLGAWVPVGAGEVKFSWQQADLAGTAGGASIDDLGARQLALGYVHSLSKRTALYATVARIDNDGASTYAIPGGPAGLAGGAASTGAEFGLRHTF